MDRIEAVISGFECDNTGSQLHQLALMTALRMAVTERAQDCDVDMEMDEDVVRHEVLINTDLKEILHRTLSFSDE